MSERLSEITKICLIRIIDRFKKKENIDLTYFQYIKNIFGYNKKETKKEIYERENNYDIV